MIIRVNSLDIKLKVLARMLPPIKLSIANVTNSDGSKDVSLTQEVGYMLTTSSANTAEQVLFRNFLEVRGILLLYILNILKSDEFVNNLWLNLDNFRDRNYISTAFSWGMTEQGRAFWEDHNNALRQL